MTMKQPKLTEEESLCIGRMPNKKELRIADNAKHVFVCGTTGSGKTVALSNFIKRAVDKDYGLLVVDGKGDVGEGSILDIVMKMRGHKKVYVINLNNPTESDKYNPFQDTTPTVVKDMLINMTNWSEEHYKLNTERYLQRLVYLLSMSETKLSFKNIIRSMPSDKFNKLSMMLLKSEVITKEDHQENLEISGASKSIIEGATARFSTIIESDIRNVFDDDGIDIYNALCENAIIVFILNPLLYPEISPLMGKLILIDSKKAVSKCFGDGKRKFFVYDEIASYGSNAMLDIVNKSRSANVTCVLATQSLSDLDTVSGTFKEQVIENCNNYIVLRQNSGTNAETWATILGTRQTLEPTFQLRQDSTGTKETGYGSARRVRMFQYHPDDIKVFGVGHGVYMSKDTNFHSNIIINKPF